MTVKLKSNLYIGRVNIFLIFHNALKYQRWWNSQKNKYESCIHDKQNLNIIIPSNITLFYTKYGTVLSESNQMFMQTT